VKAFLDTSSLLKLYHVEQGTEDLVFALQDVTAIYLSDLARLEFNSAVWKKVRTKEIDSKLAHDLLACFAEDFSKFSWITLDASLFTMSVSLLERYGVSGLRTLDSIQLSSALTLKDRVDTLYLTHDKRLEIFFVQEGLVN
jgi:predicted nucleic acid-binding protein